MRTIKFNKNNQSLIINEACKVLSSGGLVVFPSDTVYGLLADATNKKAVDKLIALKDRPFGKAISIFVDGWKMLETQVKVNPLQKQTLQEILPGAFTVVLSSKHCIDSRLESENQTLGVRLVKYSLINELVKIFGKPLTATSANLSGKQPHYQLSTFQKELSAKKSKLIDLVIDAGRLPRNKPSTVIDLTKATIKILRHGDKSMNNIYISKSEKETKKIALSIFNQNIKKTVNKPLVFIISGELGAGKTIFIKGIGEELGINNIISPTYTIAYEYPLKDKFFKKLLHFDLYQIDNIRDLKRVGIEEALIPNNILLFEWGEKVGNLIKLINKRAYIVYISIEYVTEGSRKLRVSYNHEILAIDTSADETAVAVVEGRKIISNIIYSQIQIHKKWGGIYPTLAKRAHEERIDGVVAKAIKGFRSYELGVKGKRIKNEEEIIDKIGAIAVTQGPGLAIALEVGIRKAKELATQYQKPLIAVNHLEGHLYSCFAQNQVGNPDCEIKFPYLGLIISGGHTQIVLIKNHLQYQTLGETLDDAAGEALDKAAKLLGLGYPGGPVIERLAQEVGQIDKYHFPRPMLQSKNLGFSFSGLKTSFYYYVRELPEKEKIKSIKYLVSSFQEAVFDVIVKKTESAIKQTGVRNIIVGGGVCANLYLRKLLRKMVRKNYGTIIFPPFKYLTGDNAAMIGIVAGYKAHANKFVKNFDQLDRVTRMSL